MAVTTHWLPGANNCQILAMSCTRKVPTTVFLLPVLHHSYDPKTLLIVRSNARNLPGLAAYRAVLSFDEYDSRVQSNSALVIFPRYFQSDDFAPRRLTTVTAKRQSHRWLRLSPSDRLFLVVIAPSDNHFSGCSDT